MSKSFANLTQFKKGLRDASRKAFPAAVKKAQSDIAGRIYSGVVLKTPVLSGHARHNWMPSIGYPVTEELEGVFGGEVTGDGLTDTEITKMQRVQRKIEAAPLGEAIYLSNNVPYIELLENGRSNKAPHGMVEVTIVEVLEQANSNGKSLLEGE